MAKTSKTYDGTHGVAAGLGPSAPRRTGDETRTGKVFPRGEGGKEPRNRQQRRGGKEPSILLFFTHDTYYLLEFLIICDSECLQSKFKSKCLL